MAVLEILKFPDPRLRKKCSSVPPHITRELKTLAEDMLETMYAFQGLGLSAIQVNHFVRLFTADTRPLINENQQSDEKTNQRYSSTSAGVLEQQISQPLVLFNPKIVKREGHTTFNEGCLSFPSYYAEVPRAQVIEVEGLDLSGQCQKIKTDGILSICIQHEIDHLNGKLFIDYLSPVKSERLLAQIKKHGYPDLQPVGLSSKSSP